MVTESGIKLKSGQTLDADIIITATGLKIQFGGGATVAVDNEPVHLGQKYTWRGAMMQDLPNFTFVFGYTNASWTLGADATAQLWVRILKTMRDKGLTTVVPKVGDKEVISNVPFLNLNSTYIKAAEPELPKGGDRGVSLILVNRTKSMC